MSAAYEISPYSEDALPEQISPEGAEIANKYLSTGCSILATSDQLGIPTYSISATIEQPLVRKYINRIISDTGFRRMESIMQKVESLIDKKWDEIEEAEIGSNKDIADLLAMAHKMSLDFNKVLAVETAGSKVVSQKNTQVNLYGEGSYGKLMQKLIEGT